MNCLSDLALDEELAGAARPDAEAHLRTCARCRARLDQLADERQRFAASARPAAFADQVLQRARAQRRRPLALLLAVPAAALLVVGLWLAPRREGSERWKGSQAALLELYVRSSAGATQRFAPANRYRSGDALQLVYSIRAPLHLAVVDVEDGGKATLLYRSPRALDPANRRALDRSFVLDGTSAVDRLCVVLTEEPADERALLEAAAHGRLNELHSTWRAQFEVQRAR